ncbi:MAG: SDR family oxidoreductase, partial [Desulfobulbaceae bacterium]|nr:SDR family oxidoreductase [Desulfobulbaceae bacterium]
NALKENHEIIKVGYRNGDIICDYTDPDSVDEMFEKSGRFDALISVVGNDSVFKPYPSLAEEDYLYGFERKFLGQIRLVKKGMSHINDNGVFVLTSGFLSHYPNPYSLATGPLNAAVDTYVKNGALLLQRGIRLNVVSPAPVVDSGQQPQKGTVTAKETAEYYTEAIDGEYTGKILRAWGGLPVPQES